MARPATKEQLETQSADAFRKLLDMVDSFSPEERAAQFPFEDRDRNVRDVLAHLREWHLMMLDWYAVGMAGRKPAIPAEGHTWRTTPELNAEIWAKYQDQPEATVRAALDESHNAVSALIAAHTNDELFEKKRYPWTGTTSLGAYLISSTSSHYDWALKKLRAYKKTLPKAG